jgi:hypothetical protein
MTISQKGTEDRQVLLIRFYYDRCLDRFLVSDRCPGRLNFQGKGDRETFQTSHLPFPSSRAKISHHPHVRRTPL